MQNAQKTIRSYIGLKNQWKIIIAALAAAAVIFGCVSFAFKGQAEPEPVPFDPMNAKTGDYCYFDAVGVSRWLYREETKNGSYTSTNTYYIAQDAEGRSVIVDLDVKELANLFSQQLYFSGASPGDSVPKPYRLCGLVSPMTGTGEVRKNIADLLEIDKDDEFESYFGSMYLRSGQSPKKMGSARFEAFAIFAAMSAVAVVMGNMKTISNAAACFKDLKKYGRLEDAAQQLLNGNTGDPLIVGDGYLFMQNNGTAICPEAVKKAECSGTTVSVKTRLDFKPIILDFDSAGEARRFMEFIPLECVRDDEIMIKTDSPEKYDL